MLSEAASLEWKKTHSGIEALIQEAYFIKKIKPFYNIALKDDKQYFYVVLTADFFPRVYISHSSYNKKEFFASIGPFTDGNSLKKALKILRQIIFEKRHLK